MAIIQLPAAGWSKEQIQYVVLLLEKYVVGHQKGVQVLCPKEVVENASSRKEFIRNVNQYIPPSYSNLFHAPISPHSDDPRFNLLSPQSVDYYRSLAGIVHEAGGSVMVIHCNTVFAPDQWKVPLTDYGYIQANIFPKIQKHLREIVNSSPITIAIENMPLPLKGDKTSVASEIPFDPCLLTIEQMLEFIQHAPAALKFVFDTSHYGIMMHKVNSLFKKYNSAITSQDIDEEKLKGIYPALITKQPSVVDAFRKLQQTGRIIQVQMADTRGTWQASSENSPGRIFEEGSEIGEGLLGKDLLTLAQHINNTSNDISISLDINVRDFLNRDEQVRSLKKVIEALRDGNNEKGRERLIP